MSSDPFPFESNPAFDDTARQICLFDRATYWMLLFAVLMSAAYSLFYLATQDRHTLPILILVTAFSLCISVIRRTHRTSIPRATYQVSGLFLLVVIGTVITVTGATPLAQIVAGLIPALFIGLVLPPRRVIPFLGVSFAGILVISWIDSVASWERLDLPAWPLLYTLISLVASSLILFLLYMLFRNLDRLIGEAGESARQLRLLYAASHTLGAMRTLDELLPAVVETLAPILKATGCYVVMRDPIDGRLRLAFPRPRAPLEAPSLAHAVIERREPIAIEDMATAPEAYWRTPDVIAPQAALGMPLIHHGEVCGAIIITETRRTRRFAPEEIARMQGLAQQVAAEIANAESLARERRQTADLTILNRVSAVVAASLDPAEVCRLVVDEISRVTGYDSVCIYLLVDRTLQLQAALGRHRAGRELPIDQETTLSRAARIGQPILSPGVDSESEACAPIYLGDEPLGVIGVATHPPRALNNDDMALLVAIAAQVAVALRNAKVTERNLRLLDEVRAANARLQEADRLKSQFLATMSHELRTPLNSIIGFSEVMLDDLAGELVGDQREFVAGIHSSGMHLLALINDVLDLSKLQAGHADLNRRPLQPQGIVDEAIAVVAPLFVKKSQTIATSLEAGLPLIFADGFRLRQILLNLLSNAHKFSPAGSPVSLAAQREDGFVRFSVIDCGDGVKPQDHERIFQEFVQIEDGPAHIQEGTGLGLPIVQRLVAMHGGRIWIESAGEPGRGAAFHFTIPVAAVSPLSVLPYAAAEGRASG